MLQTKTKSNTHFLFLVAGFNLASQFFFTGLVLFPMIVETLYAKIY